MPFAQTPEKNDPQWLPRYNLMVDAHFMAEMCAGILVAVTDDDKFDGALTLDLAVGSPI